MKNTQTSTGGFGKATLTSKMPKSLLNNKKL